jgi:hypothetical protein
MKKNLKNTLQITQNAVIIRTLNKQVMVISNESREDALLIEIAYCLKAEEHKTAHYKKIRKNTFVNTLSLKESTAIQVYACLHNYFKLKGIKIEIV